MGELGLASSLCAQVAWTGLPHTLTNEVKGRMMKPFNMELDLESNQEADNPLL